MLELARVSLRFGGLQVLQEVSLEVARGEIFGLIGPNGAGKTTLFNLITGLLKPASGTLTFEGTALAGLPPHRIVRLGLARTFQNIRLFKNMTLLQNVVVGTYRQAHYSVAALLFGLPEYRRQEAQARARALEMLAWMQLADKAQDYAGTLSYGEQRRLEIARALATGPKLLLLDEPVAGMNTGERAELMRVVRAIRDRGYTVLLIEHDMHFVMGLCDRIAVLNFGRIIACGAPQQIRSNPAVIEAYLGRDEEAAT